MDTQKLEGNIFKYKLFRIFAKRVFLPLIAIYLTTIGHVTLSELALIGSFVYATQFVLEIPTGYLADHFGHKTALVLGTFLSTISVLFYIIMPNFFGGLLAAVLFFSGGSFVSGALQAFMDETLRALHRENEYAQIMGEAQSFGLLGNVVLVSLIPLTYSLNPLLPFILGFFCLAVTFVVALTLEVPKGETVSVEERRVGFFPELRASLSKQMFLTLILVFIIFGIVSAALDQSTLYRELVFKDLGIPVQYFGFILAFGSLLAAFAGKRIHLLKKLKPAHFYLFDILYICTVLVLIGLTKNIALSILFFALLPAYDRNRSIIYESRVFEEFPNSKYKSTLISIMNFFAIGNGIWVPLLLSFSVAQTNLIFGHFVFGCFLFVILMPLLFIHNRMLTKGFSTLLVP